MYGLVKTSHPSSVPAGISVSKTPSVIREIGVPVSKSSVISSISSITIWCDGSWMITAILWPISLDGFGAVLCLFCHSVSSEEVDQSWASSREPVPSRCSQSTRFRYDLSTWSFVPYLVFLTLVEHLLFLIHLWSYFRNNLSEWYMVWFHFEIFIGFCASQLLFIIFFSQK